jgi:hypothetical protein
MADKVQQEWWGHQLDAVLEEIARYAWICEVKLLNPGVIEAVLHNDDSVCGSHNAPAFKKLRDLLMMGFVVREKAFDKLGAAQADAMIGAIRERLLARFGDKLGG